MNDDKVHRQLGVCDPIYGSSSDAVRESAKARSAARHEEFINGIIRRRLNCLDCRFLNNCAKKSCRINHDNDNIIQDIRAGKW